MARASDAKEALPRRRDVSAARSKSAAKPGDRFASTNVALMSTDQRQRHMLEGDLQETPLRTNDPSPCDIDSGAPPRCQLFGTPLQSQ